MNNIVGLHSLRFFAFLAIFMYHSESKFSLGYLGADFFFVLSSFLLTLLALNEIEKKQSFSRVNFFIRRVLRVFPLYFVVVAISFLGIPLIANFLGNQVSLPEQQWMYWTFLSNYESSDSIFALKFLWTVAVEEQFYLVFMLLSYFFAKRFWIPITLLFATYFIFMYYAHLNDLSTHIHTLTHFSNFGFGMLTAYCYRKIKLTSIALIGMLGTTVLLCFADVPKVIFHLLTSILFCSTIIVTITAIEKFNLTRIFKPTEFLGRYTYGLYLFSGFVLTLGAKYLPFQNKDVAGIVELFILLIISMLSYHTLEVFFLKLKKYFR